LKVVEMFRKKRNIIECDEGFSVERKHPYLIYREGDKIVRVYYELTFQRLFQKSSLYVYLGYPEYWESPYDKEKITQDDWIRIRENIKKACLSKKIITIFQMMSPEQISSCARLEKALEDKKKGIPPRIKTYAEWLKENKG
jgi:hypothetical protein